MTVPGYQTSAIVETELAVTYKPRWISQIYANDLNRDGYSDIVILGASYPSDGAPVPQPSLVAFGSSTGAFTVATQQQFPFASLNTVHPREVVFGDFNADGYNDMFVASHGYDAQPFPGEQNQLFLSNGNGTWRDATATLPQQSTFSHSAAVGDLDGDGDLDIAVGDQFRSAPVMLVNNGQGGFTNNESILPTSAGGALNLSQRVVTSVQLTDLDGDGKPDFVAGAAFSTDANPVPSLVLWNEGGSFKGASTVLPYPGTFGKTQLAYDIQSMDVNLDGRPDLLVAYQRDVWLGGWELQVLVNEGNRQFSDQTATYMPDPAMLTNGLPNANDPYSQYWLQFIEPADLNGDGLTDFWLNARGSTAAPASLPVAYIHQANGTFAAATVADLGQGNFNWVFDFSTVYVKAGGTSGFVHTYTDAAGKTLLHLLPVEFEPVVATTPQTVAGSAASDELTGGTANDTITGGGGNDTIAGGDGRDSATFSGAHGEYTIVRTQTGVQVTDGAAGRDGTDTLTGVERLVFSDGVVAMDIDGNAGKAYRLYQATFDRTPDVPGLGFQTSALDLGFPLTEVAGNFILSPEFQATYGALDNTEFLTQLYANVLGRAPDTEGLAYHLANLQSGVPRSYVLVGFSESPENQANVIGAIENGMFMTF